MSEKLSTVILKVDLHCIKCSKKIKDTLSQLQDRCNIRSIEYDEKNNRVAISGPFDPEKLIKKICCKACKVILEIHIVEDQPTPPATEPVATPPAQPETAPEQEIPKQDPPTPPATEPVAKPPAQPETAPEHELPKQDQPQKDETAPPATEPEAKPREPAYPHPAWNTGPGCCCWRPWHESYYGGCRCCTCGSVYGQDSRCPPPPSVYMYGGPCYDGPKTCQFIYEEQPAACVIM